MVYHHSAMTLKNKSDGLHKGNLNTNTRWLHQSVDGGSLVLSAGIS